MTTALLIVAVLIAMASILLSRRARSAETFFWGNDDLFSAVAVSGTASLFLLPVILFSIWGGRTDVPVWSYVLTFLIAIGGSALYFTESSGYSQWMGDMHKYTKLLFISLAVIVSGCLVCLLGIVSGGARRPAVAGGRA